MKIAPRTAALSAVVLSSLAAHAVAFQTPGAQSLEAFARAAQPAESLGLMVDLQVDLEAHGAFLDHLAVLRQTRQSQAFRETLAAYRASLHQNAAELVELIESSGATVVGERWLQPALIVEGASPSLVAELGSRAHVANGEALAMRAPQGLSEALDAQHHDSQGANALSVGGTPIEGDGVTIAIIDSGIELSLDITGRPHRTFYEDGDPTTNAGGIGGSRIVSAEGVEGTGFFPIPSGDDVNGHGTRMASIAAGASYPSLTFGVADGPAPGASIRSIEISDGQLSGIASVCAMVNAFELVATYPDVLVANMSYDGSPGPGQAPTPSIEAAVRSGIVVTLSAGNQGTGSIMHGTYNAIPVGASFLDTQEVYNAGQNFTSAIGPLPDGRTYPLMLAVGEELTSAALDTESSSLLSFGTSGSAAIVAGTAALVRQAEPSLSALETKALLLNTTDTQVAGNENAIGFGYLQSKAAVEQALAGNVTTRTAISLDTAVWPVQLAAGETFDVTTTWERTQLIDASNCFFAPNIQLPKPIIADLDIVVRDNSGTLLSSSRSGFDNVESIRFTAPQAGTYLLEVEVINFEVGTSAVTYAVAGVSGAPTTIIPNLCPATTPVLLTTQDGTVQLPLLSSPTRSVFKGCGLEDTTAVTIGGLPASFEIFSTKAIEVEIPFGLTEGSQVVQLTLNSGATLGSSIALGSSTPLLTAPFALGLQLGSQAVTIQRNPFESYGIGLSLAFGETNIPGIADLEIGGGNPGAIFTVKSGVTNSQGIGQLIIPEQTFGLLPGTRLYFQGVVFDLIQLELVPSNVGTTLIAF